MKVKNIAILEGEKTSIRDGVITYNPVLKETKDEQGIVTKEPISSSIRTDIKFIQGIVEFKFKAAEKKTGILIVSADKKEEIYVAGLSLNTNSFRILSIKAKVDITSGGLSQFKANEEISVRFEIFGSESKLYVNNVLYCESDISPNPAPLSFRITSTGKVSLYDINVETIRPKLFVIMQFTEEYNKLYSDVIIPISEKLGLEVIRADEFYSSTPILNDIIRSIKESSIIIADITPDNPNVFYEIGYAHAIQKPTILVCDKVRERLPFDVSSFRTLFYENTIAGKAKIEKSLKKYLENIFESGM